MGFLERVDVDQPDRRGSGDAGREQLQLHRFPNVPCGSDPPGGTEYDEYTLVKLIDGVGDLQRDPDQPVGLSVGFSALDAPLTGELGVRRRAWEGFTDVIAFSGTTALTATSSLAGRGFLHQPRDPDRRHLFQIRQRYRTVRRSRPGGFRRSA